MSKATRSERILKLAISQAAAGDMKVACNTARGALVCARVRRDRANALDFLARTEESPFVRYRLSRELSRLRSSEPHVWALVYHSATSCGFHRAASMAKERYAVVKKTWEVQEGRRIRAEWDRIKQENPDLYDEIKAIMDRH
jgi:hypothetical protein